MAYVLWNIASAKGNKDAAEFRDLILNEVSTSQISEAQSVSSMWAESGKVTIP